MKPTNLKLCRNIGILTLVAAFCINSNANTLAPYSSKASYLEKLDKETTIKNNTISCNTVDCIRTAMLNAKAGDEIIIDPGTYSPDKKIKDDVGKFVAFTSNSNGTPTNPIVLRGASSTNKPILKSELRSYILSITGNNWVIRDIEFSGGLKGIMLDEANNCKLLNLEVHNIDQEAIHFRSGSSNNLLKGCKIYNTGLVDAGFGEAIYVGSDRKQHDQYVPYCNGNIIEGNIIGPNVRAEGVDVKEGTSGTIIRGNIFSAKGISGANSADAFIDLKGSKSFVYKNTFNRDGSNILASGIDVQQRTSSSIPDNTTGYRNAIFSNIFNFEIADIPSIRKKGGNPTETHLWNNTRIPESENFPGNTGTEKVITKSCPSWNIVPCDGTGGENPNPTPTPINSAPSVSITSPSNNADFTTGTDIVIQVTAYDTDGSISKVEFYNGTTKLGTDNSSPYSYTITNAAAGSYELKVVATDNEGAATTSSKKNISVTNKNPDPDPNPNPNPNPNPDPNPNPTPTTPCTFGTPSSNALPIFDKVLYKKMYILGNGGPDKSNFKKFSIKWIPAQNGLYNFAYSTKNGVPNYYVDLKNKVNQNFNSSKPSVSINNSGVDGLDGDYWVAKDGESFVMVSKDKGFTLYFSNSTVAPSCASAKIASGIAATGITVYPNPATSQISFDGLTDQKTLILISDLQGKVLLKKSLDSSNNTLDINFLETGIYLIISKNEATSSVTKLSIK